MVEKRRNEHSANPEFMGVEVLENGTFRAFNPIVYEGCSKKRLRTSPFVSLYLPLSPFVSFYLRTSPLGWEGVYTIAKKWDNFNQDRERKVAGRGVRMILRK